MCLIVYHLVKWYNVFSQRLMMTLSRSSDLSIFFILFFLPQIGVVVTFLVWVIFSCCVGYYDTFYTCVFQDVIDFRLIFYWIRSWLLVDEAGWMPQVISNMFCRKIDWQGLGNPHEVVHPWISYLGFAWSVEPQLTWRVVSLDYPSEFGPSSAVDVNGCV